MSNPFKTTKFRQLHSKWMGKLIKSGFKDIEKGEKLLRHDGDWFHKHINSLKFESTRDFYLKCDDFYRTHEFQTKEHEHIFGLFCEGKTLDQIVDDCTLSRSNLQRVIVGYLDIMRKNHGHNT